MHGFAQAVELPYNPISSDTQGGMGGTCVIRGCVPKKLMVYASHYSEDFKDAEGYGWTVRTLSSSRLPSPTASVLAVPRRRSGCARPLRANTRFERPRQIPEKPTFDWTKLVAAKNKELDRLVGVYGRIMGNNNVEMYEGRGTIVDAHTVDVNGKQFKCALPDTHTHTHSLSLSHTHTLSPPAPFRRCGGGRTRKVPPHPGRRLDHARARHTALATENKLCSAAAMAVNQVQEHSGGDGRARFRAGHPG